MSAIAEPRSESASQPAAAAAHTHTHAGRIGPNAITRLAEAIDAFETAATTRRIFRTAGLERYIGEPPGVMVDEREVVALHRILGADLGTRRAKTVSWIAGRRTADYLLANRIPQPVQRLLKLSPPAVASRILISAISRHSWTFAGTGTVVARTGHPTVVEVGNCPVCRGATSPVPLCDYYAATFERLFSVLVSAGARASETACIASGAPACRFEIFWR